VVLFGVATAACGGETDGSLHSPAAGDPSDPHYKRGGDPFTFIHAVDDGRDVTVEISVGPGNGTMVEMPAGWSFVVNMGGESKPVTSGKTSFSTFVGKTEPVRVELQRPDRATSVFEILPPPVFDDPRAPTKVTIGSSVSVLMSAIELPPNAFECKQGTPCTWVSVSADATCVSWDSSVRFQSDTPSSFVSPRVVELPILASELSDGPCSGRIEMRASRHQDWSDGSIYFGRTRGPSVAFER
jgi:hypothetical protein